MNKETCSFEPDFGFSKCKKKVSYQCICEKWLCINHIDKHNMWQCTKQNRVKQ